MMANQQILSKDNYSYGIYNFSNEGRCSWFDFALKIKEISNASIKINPITSDAYPTLAKRPKYSLLDKTKIKNYYQLEIADWEESLEKELKIILKN
jgi:dTDP-4-dehydrorhamnose reductase